MQLFFFYMYHCQISPSHAESKDTQLESLMRRNDERVQFRAKTNLSRSKSMGSLLNSTGSIDTLKTLFEAKAAMQNKVKNNYRATNFTLPYKAADMSMKNGEAEEVKNTTGKPKTQIYADASVVDAKSNAKEDHVARKVNKNKQKDIQ